MASHLLRRFLTALPVLWLVWTGVFLIARLAPGSALALYDSPMVPRQSLERLRQAYGLDQPLPHQYFQQLASALRGDFAISTSQGRPVAEVVGEAMGPTLLLATTALLLQFGVGTAVGLFAASRRGRLIDRGLDGLALLFHSIPTFWLAILLVMTFSSWLGWLPSSHMQSPLGDAGLADRIRHLLLPAATLTLAGLAVTARHARGGILDALEGRFAVAARARGLSVWRIVWRHGLGQALRPLVTLAGLSLPLLLSGALVVEVIFAWPGLGRITFEAILARDVPVVQATAMITATLVIAGSLLADLLLVAVDPRLRDGMRGR